MKLSSTRPDTDCSAPLYFFESDFAANVTSSFTSTISSSGSSFSPPPVTVTLFTICPASASASVTTYFAVKVSFAPNPKEVTAIGALISLNYAKAINPSEDTYFGFEEEEPGKVLRYQDVNAEVQDSVVRLFRKFTEMFKNENILDVLSDLGYSVDNEITSKLSNYAVQSLRQMKDSSSEGQKPTDKLKEPMFFWPLKNSLYIIGKELAENSANEISSRQ